MTLIMLFTFGAVSDGVETIDFAQRSHIEDWLRHPVYGDPSFDAFERMPGNPVHRGAPPFEWPVNGFLFEDPPSRNWFLYVGLYAEGYALREGLRMACTVYRSKDRGQTWQHLGPALPEVPFYFEGVPDPIGHAPDVSVVYEDGRYHMVYDWASEHTRWETILDPKDGTNNGIGYACAERPEGPFVPASQAIYRITDHPFYREKYRRMYAASLIRRQSDWLVLAMMDSGPYYSWALVGMTAAQPEGPYSEPTFLRCVDDGYYHPPLLEFYPAFQYDGYVYAPATSVALNRNFQAVFRARTEEAMDPRAWELDRHGSVWHAEPVEAEYFGIWGQTLSCFVDQSGTLRAMFPSRDAQGRGTINLAQRLWSAPYRESGFTLSGHQGPSLALLRKGYASCMIETELELHGQMELVWGYSAPLGPDRPAADATLHPASLSRHYALNATAETWQLVSVGESDAPTVLGEGKIAPASARTLRVRHAVDGQLDIAIDGAPAWSGTLDLREGAVGLLAAAHTVAKVRRFAVTGAAVPGRLAYLYTEAILGAGAAKDCWQAVDAPVFRYGLGAESLTSGARAKWNVTGTSVTLWAPRGPRYGTADLYIDGVKAATLDFHAPETAPSAPIFAQTGLEGPRHAISIQVHQAPVPLDVLEVEP